MNARQWITHFMAAGGASALTIAVLLALFTQQECPEFTGYRVEEWWYCAKAYNQNGQYSECNDTLYVAWVRRPNGRVMIYNTLLPRWMESAYYWSMNEGSGLITRDMYEKAHGSLVGATWAERDGSPCLHFDGNPGYAVSLPSSVNVPDSSFTLSLKFKVDDFGVPDARLISKATSTAEQDHWFMLSTFHDNALRFRLKADGFTYTLISDPNVVSAGVWHDATVWYNGVMLMMGLDGHIVGAMGISGPCTQDDTVPVAIGNQPQGTKPFHGYVDEVKIW